MHVYIFTANKGQTIIPVVKLRCLIQSKHSVFLPLPQYSWQALTVSPFACHYYVTAVKASISDTDKRTALQHPLSTAAAVTLTKL